MLVAIHSGARYGPDRVRSRVAAAMWHRPGGHLMGAFVAGRDLTLPVYGASDLLDYLEKNTRWVERIGAGDCAQRPHACFLRLALPESHLVQDGEPHDIWRLLHAHQDRLAGNTDCAFVLDYAHEGPSFNHHFAPSFQEIHRILRELDIPAGRVTLLHHNVNMLPPGNAYLDWCQRQGTAPMHMMFAHFWLLDQAALVRQRYGEPEVFAAHEARLLAALDPRSGQKTHKFLSFNYWPRFQRVLLLLHMLERGYFEDGLVSFPGFRIPESDVDFMEDSLANIPHWRSGRRLRPWLAALRELSPLRVDSDASTGKGGLMAHFVNSPFLASGFSIVTDTGFSDGVLSCRVTEKFLKPVLHMHPFVMVGEPGSLDLVRDLGFATFEPLLDETYDRIADPQLRMERIMSCLDELCRLSLADVMARVRDLLPVLQANLHHAVYGLHSRLREESEYPVVNHLLDHLGLPGPRLATRFAPGHGAAVVQRGAAASTPLAGGAALPMEEALRQPLSMGAVFEPGDPAGRVGAGCWVLRATGAHGNHCVLLRFEQNLEQSFALRFDARPNGAQRMLIEMKDPSRDGFCAVFDFSAGAFVSVENLDQRAAIVPSVRHGGDGWFSLAFTGPVGSGGGPLDIVLYLGRPDFLFEGDDQTEIWFAGFELSCRPALRQAA